MIYHDDHHNHSSEKVISSDFSVQGNLEIIILIIISMLIKITHLKATQAKITIFMVIIMVVWWCEHNKTKSGPQPKYVIEQQPRYFNRICCICLTHNVNDAAIHDSMMMITMAIMMTMVMSMMITMMIGVGGCCVSIFRVVTLRLTPLQYHSVITHNSLNV